MPRLVSIVPNLKKKKSQKCIAETQILQICLPWAIKRSPEGFTIFSFHRAFVASRKWQTNCYVGKHEVSCPWRKMIQTLSKTLGIWLRFAREMDLGVSADSSLKVLRQSVGVLKQTPSIIESVLLLYRMMTIYNLEHYIQTSHVSYLPSPI